MVKLLLIFFAWPILTQCSISITPEKARKPGKMQFFGSQTAKRISYDDITHRLIYCKLLIVQQILSFAVIK